ncbi:hypothetical protein [Luteimicrobium subarcticum]|uniref:Uncharacterized protein n=1 Tax=Luteimicrobium subarcticum TaxID=620910 RepID=A0A2M8WJI1_9MICO|nr:hypothetical protein [Luteimicrobium subarcticum]PJI91090.1 hypothetical protein CLV34_2354 [Luteimicrobium subarcticum]
MGTIVDWSALGQVLLAGLVVGAGLPALFALGLRGVFQAEGRLEEDDPLPGGVSVAPPRRALGVVTATVCFGLVLAAVVGGLWLIVKS